MKLHKILDSSNPCVMGMLTTAFAQITDSNIIQNYHPSFSHEPCNIFFILNDKTGRFSNGAYYVLEDDGKYLCSAGWNHYESDTALALVRAYVHPTVRTKYYMGEYILPKIIEETVAYEHLYITAEPHNVAIYQWFNRASSGKTPSLFGKWPPIYDRFKPIGKKIINYTEQYVMEYDKNVNN